MDASSNSQWRLTTIGFHGLVAAVLLGFMMACSRSDPPGETAVIDLPYRVLQSAELATSSLGADRGTLSLACTDERSVRIIFAGRLPAPPEFVRLGDADDASLAFGLRDSIKLNIAIVQIGTVQAAHSEPLTDAFKSVLSQRLNDPFIHHIALSGIEESSMRFIKTQQHKNATNIMNSCV